MKDTTVNGEPAVIGITVAKIEDWKAKVIAATALVIQERDEARAEAAKLASDVKRRGRV